MKLKCAMHVAQIEELGFQFDSLEQVTEITVNLSDQLLNIAKRIERLGLINLAAIDEYNKQKERKEYLLAQTNDLASALESLEGAIKRIDKETTTQFQNTFTKINANLEELFPKIFGGGRASLQLSDAGVSIIAQPPGKRNASVHLLSGGEKALTAIALVFAIFKINPAPFCLLDEVDAPFDDENIGRFCRLIKEMSQSVQFIYISHNKISMEVADQLLGITMHEPGVSRLVAVDMTSAMAMLES